MKKLLYKTKSVLALALAMSVFSTQVFAATTIAVSKKADEKMATEEVALVDEKGLPYLTLENALDRALKNNTSLQTIEDSLELFQDNEDKLKDRVNTSLKDNYDFRTWVDEEWYTLVSTAYTLESNQKTYTYKKELLEMGLELSLQNSFASILGDEDELEYKKLVEENKHTLYLQGYTKYRLGMLSKYGLDQLQTAYESAKNDVAVLEAKLEQQYLALNNLIGANTDDRFHLVYDLEYVPYELPSNMTHYINQKMEEDLSIKLQEEATDNAKFKYNYRISSWTATGTSDQDKLTYDAAQRTLKTAKQDKEVAIRDTALTIQQMDSYITSAQNGLEQVKAAYRVAEINYQIGNITKVALDQAKMAVMQTEMTLNDLLYQYDLLTYTFEHTALLGQTE